MPTPIFQSSPSPQSLSGLSNSHHTPGGLDGNGNASDTADVSVGNVDDGDEDEEYKNFLNGLILLDGEDGQDDTEEESEEDYTPAKRSLNSDGDFDADSEDDADSEEDDDDDDDDDEDGTEKARIGKLELKELLQGTLQAVAGEAPRVPDGELLSDNESMSRASSISSTAASSPRDLDEQMSPRRLLTRSTSSRRGVPSEASSSKISKASVAAVLSEMYSGEGPADLSDMLHYGMPVKALRLLLARQMSMAAQLLIQVLLQASHRDEQTSTECSHRLFELGNLRQTAVRQAALIEQTFNSADSRRAEEHVQQRLTRARVLQTNTKERGGSVLDVPIYSDVPALLRSIDRATKAVATQITELGDTQSDSETENAPDQQRVHLLSKLGKQSKIVSLDGKMRHWDCLVPTPSYPMSEEAMQNTDPTSLVGRHLFTPAEDDLLLRAVVKLGEGQWQRICTEYLVSKTPDQVQFRFDQMTSIGGNISSNAQIRKFSEYRRLSQDYRNRDQGWQHWEDLSLLRGFAVYGKRWPLVQMYHIPHRGREDIIGRWAHLQHGNLGIKSINKKGQRKSKGVRSRKGNIQARDLKVSANLSMFLQNLLNGNLNTYKEHTERASRAPASISKGRKIEENIHSTTGGNARYEQDTEERSDSDSDAGYEETENSFQLPNPSSAPTQLGHDPIVVTAALAPPLFSRPVKSSSLNSGASPMPPPMGVPLRTGTKPVGHNLLVGRSRPPRPVQGRGGAGNAGAVSSMTASGNNNPNTINLMSAIQNQTRMLQQQQDKINAQMAELRQAQADLKRERTELEQNNAREAQLLERPKEKKRRIVPQAMGKSIAAAQVSAAPRAFADARLAPLATHDELSYSSGGSNSANASASVDTSIHFNKNASDSTQTHQARVQQKWQDVASTESTPVFPQTQKGAANAMQQNGDKPTSKKNGNVAPEGGNGVSSSVKTPKSKSVQASSGIFNRVMNAANKKQP